MTAILESEAAGIDLQPKKRYAHWSHRLVFMAIMFFTGAAGLIYEYILGTVNSYLLGNSILQMSITIGAMFFMMGLGGLLQRFIKGWLVECFIAAELLLVLLGGFAPIALQWVFAYDQASYETVKWLYMCAIGMLVGIEIPLVMRINERFSASLGDNIAGTWSWDYLGGAAGVGLWIFMLTKFVPMTHISFIIAAANLIVAVISLVFFWKRGLMQCRLSGYVASLLALATVIVTLVGWSSVDNWSKIISQKLYDNPIVFQAATPYQQIVMTKGQHPSDPGGANYELYLNGNKQFSSVDERIYHELLIHPAMNTAASQRNVLVLGGGDGLAVREIVKYPDVRNITLVDLDPEMTKLARENPVLSELNEGAFDDARVNPLPSEGVINTGSQEEVIVQTNDPATTSCTEVASEGGERQSSCTQVPVTRSIGKVDIFNIDADRFMSSASGPWDVVVIDLPDPNSVELAKLYSVEFYQKIRRNMSPDGVVVVQSTSPYHAKETFLCILRTMSAAGLAVVPYHDNVPSFGDWGWIIGSRSLTESALYDKLQSMESFSVETQKVDPAVLRRALVFNKDGLTSSNTTVSTLMEPTVFQYYTYEGWRVE